MEPLKPFGKRAGEFEFGIKRQYINKSKCRRYCFQIAILVSQLPPTHLGSRRYMTEPKINILNDF